MNRIRPFCSNKQPMGCGAQLTFGQLLRGNVPGEGVHIPMQDYKFLCVAVVIWATEFNTQTH